MRYVHNASSNDRTTHRLGFERPGTRRLVICDQNGSRSAILGPPRARERGPHREFGKLVFFSVVKRAVYKRSVGRGQGAGVGGDPARAKRCEGKELRLVRTRRCVARSVAG